MLEEKRRSMSDEALGIEIDFDKDYDQDLEKYRKELAAMKAYHSEIHKELRELEAKLKAPVPELTDLKEMEAFVRKNEDLKKSLERKHREKFDNLSRIMSLEHLIGILELSAERTKIEKAKAFQAGYEALKKQRGVIQEGKKQ